MRDPMYNPGNNPPAPAFLSGNATPASHHHHHHHHHSASGVPTPAPPPQPSQHSLREQTAPAPQYLAQPPYPPPPHGQPVRPEMAALHPHAPHYTHGPPPPSQDSYRLPAPHTFYSQPPPHDPHYRPPPQTQPAQGQTAPRQRTAIACKYCRRRKIRCSGFENSEDGRCNNCVRFNQECVFTPVSAQTQAFVPAQALYGRGRGGPAAHQQLYGAYGQRLPDGYAPHPAAVPPPPHVAGYPPHAYAAHLYHAAPPQHYAHPYPPPPPIDTRRRGREEQGHPPTLPPPNPGLTSTMGTREEHPYYPDPSVYGPQSPTAAYPPAPQPYYAATGAGPPRRSSPGQGGYSYSKHESRDSSSPQGSNYSYQQSHAGPTPPPANASRPGMSIHDMVDRRDEGTPANGGGERSAADSDMVGALNRHRR